MDVNIIEYFFNFFSGSDFMYMLFLIINVLYIGVNDYQDDCKILELLDLRNVSFLNLFLILLDELFEMFFQFLKVFMNVVYLILESYWMVFVYIVVVMLQLFMFYYSFFYIYLVLIEEIGFFFGLFLLYQYGFLIDLGGF